VQADEVAVLALVEKGKFLRFVLPEKLQSIGTIPLNSTVALAAKTVREKKGEIENTFATSRHASVFEGVPLGRRQGEMIYKIMSAPIVAENKAVGVVQISRKARTAAEAGPDFKTEDMRKLQGCCTLLARLLRLLPPR
jgi:hypothetical protein